MILGSSQNQNCNMERNVSLQELSSVGGQFIESQYHISDKLKASINIIRKNLRKRPDKETVLSFMSKKYDFDPLYVGEVFDKLEEEGEIYSRESRFGLSYFVTSFDPNDLLENDLRSPSPQGTPNLPAYPINTPNLNTQQINIRSHPLNKDTTNVNKDSMEFSHWLSKLVNSQQRAYDVLMDCYIDERKRNLELKAEIDFLTESVKLRNEINLKYESNRNSTSCRNSSSHEDPKIQEGQHTATQDELYSKVADLESVQCQLKHFRHLKHSEFVESKKIVHTKVPTTITELELNESLNSIAVEDLPNTENNLSPKKSSPPTKHVLLNEGSNSKLQQHATQNKPKLDHHAWPEGTILIAGDSILGGLEEKRMSAKNRIKVRSLPGSKIDDFFYYLPPLLAKKPSVLIIHVSTNDSVNKSAEDIIAGLKRLKLFVQSEAPGVKVVFSAPTIRADNPKAAQTIKKVIALLRNIDADCVDHSNIEEEHLGKNSKLHLTRQGTSTLALNFIKYIRSH